MPSSKKWQLLTSHIQDADVSKILTELFIGVIG